jgi:hypothetical protein
LINIGSVLIAKSTVEIDPARTAMLAMEDDATKQTPRLASGQLPILQKRLMGGFPYQARSNRRSHNGRRHRIPG